MTPLSQKTPSIAAITRGCVVKATNTNRKGRTQSITTTFSSLSKNYTMTEIELKPTELVYLKDTYVFKLDDEATVIGLRQQQDEGTNVFYEIALDKTIAYPAGGGHPSDEGKVCIHTDQNVWFHFDSVRMERETKQVWHRGSFSKDSEEMSLANVRGQKCTIEVDERIRLQHAKMHSAGHLLDVAVASIPGLETNILVPTKGSHGVKDAYVEYKGNARTLSGIEGDDEKLMKLMNENLEKLIEKNDIIKTEYLAYEDAKRACGGHLPSYISPDAEEAPRIVTVANLGCPCGGTHVKSSSELKRVTVTALRVKKGVTRISYSVDL